MSYLPPLGRLSPQKSIVAADSVPGCVTPLLISGELLWKSNLGGQMAAGPMTYQVDGRQYVAIAAGRGIFAFALPE